MRPIEESTPDHGALAAQRPITRDLARVLLWALVVAMGIQLGGGIYEHTSVVPQWSRMPPELLPDALLGSAQAHAAFGFWRFVSPAVVLLALINAFAATTARGRVRVWWFGAALLELLNDLATYAYFVPELFVLASGELPPADVESRAQAWVRLDTARIVFEAFAWSLALGALSRWRAHEPDDPRGEPVRDDTVAIPTPPGA